MANAADDRWPEEETTANARDKSSDPTPVEEAQAWGEATAWPSPRSHAHQQSAAHTDGADDDNNDDEAQDAALEQQNPTAHSTSPFQADSASEGLDEADFDDEGFEDEGFEDEDFDGEGFDNQEDAATDAVTASELRETASGSSEHDDDSHDDDENNDENDEDDDALDGQHIAAAVDFGDDDEDDASDADSHDAHSALDEALEAENPADIADDIAADGIAKDNDSDADDDALEEIYYPAESPGERLKPNSLQLWEEQRLRIDEHLVGDWYRATALPQDLTLLLSPQPRPPHWHKLPQHPVLPKVFCSCAQGHALYWTEGTCLELPLRLEQALEVILPLAQLVRFFEAQGLAVVDIEPQGLLRSPQGIRLRYPPQLMPIGEDLPKVYREGFTPPEIHEKLLTLVASGGEGVYVLAALLAYCLGIPVPAEGPDQLFFSRFRDPGVPQLFAATLTVPFKRLSPSAFVEALKALRPHRHPHFDIAAGTTVGLNPSRRLNEDSYGYVQQVIESYQGKQQLWRLCVADGMGGAAAGERASQAAVHTFCHSPIPKKLSPTTQSEWTLSLVWQANQAVLDALQGQDGGCTFTGVVLLGNVLTLGHVGDSRAYLHNAQGLQALSKDHSLVNALVASGMLSEEEAENSPDRNKVLRSLGSLRHEQDNYIDSLETMLDIDSLELALGDIVLLVSDGVWGEVKSARLGGIIERHLMQPQAIADALIKAALEAGATDNATAIVLRRSR